MPDRPYEFFEHTADVGLRAHGATLPELFHHAAQGLTVLLVEDSPIQPTETRPMTLHAASVDALLRLWLSDLLFWCMTERFLYAGAEFQTLTATDLYATVSGERYDPARHAQGTEIKGITYHQLAVRHAAAGWDAKLILDV